MSEIGITRKVDNLGRIVLPKEYRTILQIEEGDIMNIKIKDNSLLVSKTNNSCIFCNSTDSLVDFENQLICNYCCQKFLSKMLVK